MDIVQRRARIGVELIDALTGGPVAASNRVVVGDAEVLRANTSRWFVEDALPPLARVEIEAEGYVGESLDVAVPPPGAHDAHDR